MTAAQKHIAEARSLFAGTSIRGRAAGVQLGLFLTTAAVLAWLAHNTLTNLDSRGIRIGFSFLFRSARFPISQSILPYSPTDTFAWALLVGLVNTLVLSIIVGLGTTGCGLAIALGRRSRQPLARGLATWFIETIRNTPVVVQLLFWYGLLTVALPGPHSAWEPLPGVYLTNRGLYLPWLTASGWAPPHLGRFNFSGGITVTPEFAAIVAGLVLYSSSYVAEVIRAGIEAVSRGQWEGGRALGLSDGQVLRLIIAPQALRVIVPPLASQYISIIRNTTLALVVGYPDLAFITASCINQTGHAVEGVAILMLVYLTISLGASFALDRYNRRLIEARP